MLTRRFICLAVLFIAITTTGFAQDNNSDTTYWTRGGGANLNFSNVNLKNWAGGGNSSVALGALVNFFGNYEKARHSWENRVDLAYGLQRQGDKNAFRKTDDNIILISKYGYQFSKRFSVSGIMDFRTQFAEGYQYSEDSLGVEHSTFVSEFMAPGYLLSTIGLTYKRKKWLSLTLSPVTGKTTFVLNDSLSTVGAYGVDPGQKVRFQGGASFIASFNKEIIKNVSLSSNLNLFDAYKKLGVIDVNWDLTLLMKVNSFLTASVATQMIYDDDINIERDNGTVGPATQFKSAINVGLAWQFGDKRKE